MEYGPYWTSSLISPPSWSYFTSGFILWIFPSVYFSRWLVDNSKLFRLLLTLSILSCRCYASWRTPSRTYCSQNINLLVFLILSEYGSNTLCHEKGWLALMLVPTLDPARSIKTLPNAYLLRVSSNCMKGPKKLNSPMHMGLVCCR